MKHCPICGRTPTVESKVMFYELEAKNGKACLSLECKCGLQFFDYTFDEKDYDKRVEILSEKWGERYEGSEPTADA